MNIDNLTAGLRRARLTTGGRHVPDLLHEPPEWMRQAVCATVDPDLWFPETGGPVRIPKQICAGCPVKVECAALAFDNNEHHGVWGGLSERDRRRLKRGAA